MMWIDSVGWLAAGLTLAAFLMRDMQALRIAGIGANLAFIAYGVAEQLYPVVALHALLLPCNALRLAEHCWRQR
jgi:CRP/FNR family cyclic AMP-dependent transcriptional regulator